MALISSPRNTGNYAVTNRTRPISREDEGLNSPDRTIDKGAVNQNKSSWMSTAYSSTKVVIDVVKESSDVFPPLKSVVGGLAALLKHCDVRSFSLIPPTVLMIALASNSQ